MLGGLKLVEPTLANIPSTFTTKDLKGYAMFPQIVTFSCIFIKSEQGSNIADKANANRTSLLILLKMPKF